MVVLPHLKRQQDYLKHFVQKQKWTLLKAYRDIRSGLNDKQLSLLQMLKDLPVFQPDIIVCSYEDRLARFGTALITTICDIFGIKLILVKKKDHLVSLQDQLVTDVIAIITSFSGKIHRRRRGRTKPAVTIGLINRFDSYIKHVFYSTSNKLRVLLPYLLSF